jgi:hypothetical protein
MSDYHNVTVNQADPYFDAVWNVIKHWDVNVQGAYDGYCGANGNHVQMILDSINAVKAQNAYANAMKVI